MENGRRCWTVCSFWIFHDDTDLWEVEKCGRSLYFHWSKTKCYQSLNGSLKHKHLFSFCSRSLAALRLNKNPSVLTLCIMGGVWISPLGIQVEGRIEFEISGGPFSFSLLGCRQPVWNECATSPKLESDGTQRLAVYILRAAEHFCCQLCVVQRRKQCVVNGITKRIAILYLIYLFLSMGSDF